MSLQKRFTLEPRKWYAWQMFPGYSGDANLPYSSPIYVQQADPQRKGTGHLRLAFMNALYAQGVQDFTLDLRVVLRRELYMIAELDYGVGGAERSVVISDVTFEWLEMFCPTLVGKLRPPSERSSKAVFGYLNELFLGRAD
jgi:hypothetical protein